MLDLCDVLGNLPGARNFQPPRSDNAPMTTFYVAIKEDSGFDTDLEQYFDTTDNDKTINEQWGTGELTRTGTTLTDGRTLFKVASDADDVVDRYETFVDKRFASNEERSRPAIARHFNIVNILRPSDGKNGLIDVRAEVNNARLQLYMDLFDVADRDDFEARLFKRYSSTDPQTGAVGAINFYFSDSETGLFWLANFVSGLDQRFAAVNPDTAATEDRLAFVYNLLGDEGMNLYLRAGAVLDAKAPEFESVLGTAGDDGIAKWRLTERLVRKQGAYDDTGHGLGCADQPFTDAIDPVWGDECTAYEEFGGTDREISVSEFAQAATATGSGTDPVRDMVKDLRNGYQRYTFPFGTFYLDANLNSLHSVSGDYLVWQDRAGRVRYNHIALAERETVDRLQYMLFQMERHPNPDADFQAKALAMIRGCLKFADNLKSDAATTLAKGTPTFHGDVIETASNLILSDDLVVITSRGRLTEITDVPYAEFDAYIRHLQGEVVHEGGLTTPQCDDGAFTDAIDTTGIGRDDDECHRYTTLLPPGENVSLQRLDELYSYSHGATGVGQVIDHFTGEAREFHIWVRDADGKREWDYSVTIDPTLRTVEYDGAPLSEVELGDWTRTCLETLAKRLAALDGHQIYGQLLSAALETDDEATPASAP